MKVRHIFSGKMHHYIVINEFGREHNVIIQAFCDCNHEPFKGDKRLCCHIAAVMKSIVDNHSFNLGDRDENDR